MLYKLACAWAWGLNGTAHERPSASHGLVCFMRVSSCQGSPYVATLLTTFEDNLRQTSNRLVSDKWFPRVQAGERQRRRPVETAPPHD